MENNTQNQSTLPQTPRHTVRSPQEEIMALRARLATKINAVAAAIGALKPEGYNADQKYDFIGYEQVNNNLRALLVTHKLALIPETTTIEERDFQTRSGGTATRTVLKGTMLIIDTETGYSESRGMIGADQDYSGKSAGKAATEMVKRFEMKLFHISTAEDVDPDAQGEGLPGLQDNNRQQPRGQQQQRGRNQQRRSNWP